MKWSFPIKWLLLFCLSFAGFLFVYWKFSQRQIPVSAVELHVKKEGRRIQIPRAYLDERLERLNVLLEEMAIVPEVSGNRLDGFRYLGFRITNIEPGSIFSELGLEVGDLLMSLNGIQFDSVGRGLEVYAAFKSSPRLTLVLDRNGEKQEWVYDVVPSP